MVKKTDIDSILLRAKTLFDQNRWDDAINEYRKVTSIAPDNIQAHQALGELYVRKRFFDKAIEEYERVLALDPKHPAIHTIIGDLYLKIRKPEKAIEEYRKQIALEPENSALIEHLGDLYLRQGKLKEAKESYLKAAELEPTRESLFKKIKQVEFAAHKTLIKREGLLFKAVLYILYGRRAGETTGEKAVRVGLIIGFFVIIFLGIDIARTLIREHLFVERVAPIEIEWGVPVEEVQEIPLRETPDEEIPPAETPPLLP